MNKVILMGRLTREPEVRYSTGENATAVARYTLAVDRRVKRDNEQNADFIGCIAFGKSAEFAEKYFKKGTKVTISGRIQTGSYTGKEGRKIYTTDVVVEEQEFAESRINTECEGTSGTGGKGVENGSKNTENGGSRTGNDTEKDGFMHIPDGFDDELPFN